MHGCRDRTVLSKISRTSKVVARWSVDVRLRYLNDFKVKVKSDLYLKFKIKRISHMMSIFLKFVDMVFAE